MAARIGDYLESELRIALEILNRPQLLREIRFQDFPETIALRTGKPEIIEQLLTRYHRNNITRFSDPLERVLRPDRYFIEDLHREKLYDLRGLAAEHGIEIPSRRRIKLFKSWSGVWSSGVSSMNATYPSSIDLSFGTTLDWAFDTWVNTFRTWALTLRV